MRPPNQHQHLGHLLAGQVGTDVQFKVGSDLFSAHKCILATRSTAFLAEFFGPAGKENRTDVSRVRIRIDDMEPRVFKALLHFIYTDALPEVHEDDKVVIAQGLLVAADRYAMERLKLICANMLCSYISDARMAITTVDLADKHGCPRLREACKKFLMDHFSKERENTVGSGNKQQS
ncbi:BTB/POZ and MATH domain-containing protein 1-like [Miscanthus floridulus]|uniref:BTB/POZ and MATH domain-containing protein 1-like n=1 Tax=Miscanthus floridulus TaxID=154761 RepID=UPI0034586D8E